MYAAAYSICCSQPPHCSIFCLCYKLLFHSWISCLAIATNASERARSKTPRIHNQWIIYNFPMIILCYFVYTILYFLSRCILNSFFLEILSLDFARIQICDNKIFSPRILWYKRLRKTIYHPVLGVLRLVIDSLNKLLLKNMNLLTLKAIIWIW